MHVKDGEKVMQLASSDLTPLHEPTSFCMYKRGRHSHTHIILHVFKGRHSRTLADSPTHPYSPILPPPPLPHSRTHIIPPSTTHTHTHLCYNPPVRSPCPPSKKPPENTHTYATTHLSDRHVLHQRSRLKTHTHTLMLQPTCPNAMSSIKEAA